MQLLWIHLLPTLRSSYEGGILKEALIRYISWPPTSSYIDDLQSKLIDIFTRRAPGFLESGSLQELFDLYVALNATPAVVLDRIQEPEQANSAQARILIFGYLTRLAGNMKKDELSRFLRFVTGSSVVIEKRINIRFNKLAHSLA